MRTGRCLYMLKRLECVCVYVLHKGGSEHSHTGNTSACAAVQTVAAQATLTLWSVSSGVARACSTQPLGIGTSWSGAWMEKASALIVPCTVLC
jgi:hypothetical protein